MESRDITWGGGYCSLERLIAKNPEFVPAPRSGEAVVRINTSEQKDSLQKLLSSAEDVIAFTRNFFSSFNAIRSEGSESSVALLALKIKGRLPFLFSAGVQCFLDDQEVAGKITSWPIRSVSAKCFSPDVERDDSSLTKHLKMRAIAGDIEKLLNEIYRQTGGNQYRCVRDKRDSLLELPSLTVDDFTDLLGKEEEVVRKFINDAIVAANSPKTLDLIRSIDNACQLRAFVLAWAIKSARVETLNPDQREIPLELAFILVCFLLSEDRKFELVIEDETKRFVHTKERPNCRELSSAQVKRLKEVLNRLTTCLFLEYVRMHRSEELINLPIHFANVFDSLTAQLPMYFATKAGWEVSRAIGIPILFKIRSSNSCLHNTNFLWVPKEDGYQLHPLEPIENQVRIENQVCIVVLAETSENMASLDAKNQMQRSLESHGIVKVMNSCLIWHDMYKGKWEKKGYSYKPAKIATNGLRDCVVDVLSRVGFLVTEEVGREISRAIELSMDLNTHRLDPDRFKKFDSKHVYCDFLDHAISDKVPLGWEVAPNEYRVLSSDPGIDELVIYTAGQEGNFVPLARALEQVRARERAPNGANEQGERPTGGSERQEKIFELLQRWANRDGKIGANAEKVTDRLIRVFSTHYQLDQESSGFADQLGEIYRNSERGVNDAQKRGVAHVAEQWKLYREKEGVLEALGVFIRILQDIEALFQSAMGSRLWGIIKAPRLLTTEEVTQIRSHLKDFVFIWNAVPHLNVEMRFCQLRRMKGINPLPRDRLVDQHETLRNVIDNKVYPAWFGLIEGEQKAQMKAALDDTFYFTWQD